MLYAASEAPPAMLRRILIRSLVGGWVLVRSSAALPFLRNGLAVYIGAKAWLADFNSIVEPLIFSSAEANPSGYLVYSAPEASARYSLFRETA